MTAFNQMGKSSMMASFRLQCVGSQDGPTPHTNTIKTGINREAPGYDASDRKGLNEENAVVLVASKALESRDASTSVVWAVLSRSIRLESFLRYIKVWFANSTL